MFRNDDAGDSGSAIRKGNEQDISVEFIAYGYGIQEYGLRIGFLGCHHFIAIFFQASDHLQFDQESLCVLQIQADF